MRRGESFRKPGSYAHLVRSFNVIKQGCVHNFSRFFGKFVQEFFELSSSISDQTDRPMDSTNICASSSSLLFTTWQFLCFLISLCDTRYTYRKKFFNKLGKY